MLVKQLSQDFRGKSYVVYLPIDFKNRYNIGYGFINFCTEDACDKLVTSFNGVDVRKCLPGLNSRHGVAIGPKQCPKKQSPNLVFPIIFYNNFNSGKVGLRYAVSIGTFGSCPLISSLHTRSHVYSLLGLNGH